LVQVQDIYIGFTQATLISAKWNWQA